MTEETLFALALEKHDPAERAAFLAEASGDDTALRQRVEALLQSHEYTGFLQTPAIQRAAEELASETAASSADAATPSEGGKPSLDFLVPSDSPGSLGRLGHYEIQEIIGQGGMGIVLRAFDVKLHRVVAIKVMAAQLATNATARRRFTREAQAAAAVSHEHVVTIHAVEEANSLPYLVMQYVDGVSLQERLERRGTPDLAVILRIGMQTASGLAAAHAQGLIHRDIKPANILLENDIERVKITDFGLARAAADASLTQSGVIAGTPHYMSPEQARGEAVDQRSDLFTLGSVLYALCTGRPPFRASGTMAVLKRVCDETPTPIRDSNPAIPDWLAAIIARLHAKDPVERYQSAAEVAELLGRVLAQVQHPSEAAPPLVAGSGDPAATSRPRGRGRRWVVAAAVIVCLVGGLSLAEATGATHLVATVIRIFTPDGTLVVETDDPAVKVTVEGDGDLVITGAGPQEVRLRPGSYRLQATKDGKAVKLDQELVTITRGHKKIVRVRLERAERVGEVRRFEGHEGPVRSVVFSPDGRYALSGSGFPDGDKTMRLWDVTSGREVRRFEGHVGWVNHVVFSPNGERALSASFDRTVRLWDVETREKLRLCRGHEGCISALAFTADGQRALSGGEDKTVRLWDLETGQELRQFKGHTRWVQAVSLAPDGRRFLSASWDGTVRLWDLETRDELHCYGQSGNALFDVVFLPDGRRFLTGGDDGIVRLWDLDAGKVLRRFEGHSLQVFGLALSRDGSRALSASGDGTVRLWEVATGRQLHGFRHGEIVTSVAFSPDGRYALSGGGGVFRDGKWLPGADWAIRLWRLPEPPAQ